MALKMSRISDDELFEAMSKGQVEERIAHLTSEGDASEHAANAVVNDEPQPMEDVIYQNIQEIIPGLYIGDYTAAIDGKLLKSRNITFVVAASQSQQGSTRIKCSLLTVLLCCQCASATRRHLWGWKLALKSLDH